MPIYEYVCGRCRKNTEVIQRMGEAPLRVCPHCGGRLKKSFSAPAIQFKGSGWYVTDYARAKQESGGGSEKSANGGKSEKAEKAEKVEKGEKTSKSDKSEKSEKSEKGEKRKKGGGTEP